MSKKTAFPASQPLDDRQFEQILDSFLTGGQTFKGLKGISEPTMNAVYNVAYNLYNGGEYEEAMKVFQFLCFFDHYQKKYWMGLGAARQMLKLYQEAIAAYSFAAILDVRDPKPPLHAADCLLAMGNREGAESALYAAIKWAGEHAQHKALKAKAEAVLNLLKKSNPRSSSQAGHPQRSSRK